MCLDGQEEEELVDITQHSPFREQLSGCVCVCVCVCKVNVVVNVVCVCTY